MNFEYMGKISRRLRLAFAVASVVFVASLAVSPIKDQMREWRRYKREYARFAENRPDTKTLLADYHPGIDQIWIPDLNVTDRCVTCHQGIMQPSLADPSVPEPFRTHVPIPHRVRDWGCVVCHRGQGPATELQEAHETTKAWERPLLPAGYTQASCGVCNRAGIAETPRYNGHADVGLTERVHAHQRAVESDRVLPECELLGEVVAVAQDEFHRRGPVGVEFGPRHGFDEFRVGHLNHFFFRPKGPADDRSSRVMSPSLDLRSYMPLCSFPACSRSISSRLG